MGYWRAGFDIVGVDIKRQPHYPFPFVQADALEYDLDTFDAYHASPPCQLFSQLTECRPGQAEHHAGLIAPTRARLEATGKPYVIENVMGAPIRPDLLLCGTMFGYRLYRHRLFESNVPMDEPDHPAHDGAAINVYGHMDVAPAREAMAITWTTRDELSQAIPPYFTEYIGKFLLKAVMGEIQLSERSFADDLAAMSTPVHIPTPMSIPDAKGLVLLPTYDGPVYRWEYVSPPEREGMPPGAMPSSEAAVLAAVMRASPPITVRKVSDATGLSISHVHGRLTELRLKGLVSWEIGRAATLKATVQVIPVETR